MYIVLFVTASMILIICLAGRFILIGKKEVPQIGHEIVLNEILDMVMMPETLNGMDHEEPLQEESQEPKDNSLADCFEGWTVEIRSDEEQLQQEDLMELVFTEREIFRLGDSISHQGAVYYLWKSETVYDGEECVHTYHFRTKEAIAVTAIPHKDAAGCSFDATVSGVRKDRVQVTVAQDE